MTALTDWQQNYLMEKVDELMVALKDISENLKRFADAIESKEE